MTESEEIDQKIKDLTDWRGPMLARLRASIKEADPDVVEQIKWRKPSNPAGVPTYSHDGLIGTLDAFKEKVKFTFAKGAALDDPAGLLNGSRGGNTMRAVDLFEGDDVDEEAFKDLVRAAVALNQSSALPKKKGSG